MFFSTALVSLVAAGASAMPSQFHRRTAGAVYFCTGVNYTGSCTYQNNTLNTCVDLPSNYTDNVESFRPDSGAECLLMQGHCNGNEQYYSITYPGQGNLSSIHENNIATSYLCLEQFSTTESKARILSTVVKA